MNAQQLQKNIGGYVKLRPLGDLTDHVWRVERDLGGLVELQHRATDYTLRVGYDSVREFREPDVLVLRGMVRRQGRRCWLEPFVLGDRYSDLYEAAERMREMAVRAGVLMPPFSAFFPPRPPERRRLGRRQDKTRS